MRKSPKVALLPGLTLTLCKILGGTETSWFFFQILVCKQFVWDNSMGIQTPEFSNMNTTRIGLASLAQEETDPLSSYLEKEMGGSLLLTAAWAIPYTVWLTDFVGFSRNWEKRILSRFPLHSLILVCTFIDIEKKNPPACLFHPHIVLAKGKRKITNFKYWYLKLLFHIPIWQ